MLDLPLPGAGATRERFESLWRLGAVDLSLARLAEAHADAVAILAEAGHPSPASRAMGVWATGGDANRIEATKAGAGWSLAGRKAFCSGASTLDAALVTADHAGRHLLFLVDLKAPGIEVDLGGWRTPVMAATATATVVFHDVPVDDGDLVGGDDFYLARPGFWHGAIGVAAVWAGAADAIGETLTRPTGRASDPHEVAHAGAVHAARWAMRHVIAAAADEIDADGSQGGPDRREPDERQRAIRALSTRHLVERWCHEIIDRVGRALGPRPLAMDADHARRVAELQLYVRQDHAERDLEALGRFVRSPAGNEGR